MKRQMAPPPGAPAIRRASDYVRPRRKIRKEFVLRVLHNTRPNHLEFSHEVVTLLHRVAEERLYELVVSQSL